jgi:radical SAM-linked protein
VEPQIYLAELPIESRLPWDHVDCLVGKPFLLREYQRAREALLTPACEKPYHRHNMPPEMSDKLICYDCGCVCDLDHIRTERVDAYQKLLGLDPLRKPLAPPPDGGPSFRYRGAFRKVGAAKFLSHLDLLRTMSRALRRAGVSLKYSQGFNPRPLMSFSPALAVGIESQEEFLDFQSGTPLKSDALERISEALPEELRFARVAPLPEGAPSLSAAITAATYLARMPDEGGAGRDELRDAVDAFNGASERFIDKVRKERSVSLDLKRFVGPVELVEEASAGPALRFGVTLDQTEGSVKPDEVLRGILGRKIEGVSFIRERLHFVSAQGVS